MTDRATKLIHDAAIARYPEEACGLYVRKGKKVVAVECKNIAPKPREHFTLAPEDYAQCADMGEIVGVWHTHPEGSPMPSEADRYGCDASGLTWTIFALHKTDVGFTFLAPTVIEPSGQVPSLIGRPYLYGIYDCYTLVRDFYAREYGIALSDYSHAPEGWWFGDGNWFVDNFEREGFVLLPPDTPPKRGDLMFLQTCKTTTNHAAVYLGDDMILHHCTDRLSRREVWGGYWAKHMTHHCRHKELMNAD